MTKQDRTAWMLAGTIFISLFFIWGAGYDCFPILLPSVLKQFHLSREQIGWVPAAQALAALVFGPLVGWLLDQIGAQIVMGVGAVLAAIGIAMMARAGSFQGVLAGSVVSGIGLSASTILPSTMVISNWFGERRGIALGVTTAGMELGGMVIAIVAGSLVVTHGWRFAYAVLAIPLIVVVLPLCLIFVRTRPEQPADISGAGSSGDDAEVLSELPGLEVDEALRTRAFWMLVVLQFCYTFSVGGSFIHLVQYLIGIGYTEAVGKWVVGFSLGLALIGKPALGVLGDRIGGKNALALCLSIGALNIAFLLLARDLWVLVIFTFVGGLTGAAPIALGPMVQVETLGLRRYGSIAGLLAITFTLGAMLGPPMVGRLADVTGTYTVSFEVCAVVGLVGALAAFLCVAPARARLSGVVQAK
ncbi:MAG TPA: MFS transporter [Candidatus Binataceae bacterium]|nr:MFS transporter [Candidatus Binataceae bacterium]